MAKSTMKSPVHLAYMVCHHFDTLYGVEGWTVEFATKALVAHGMSPSTARNTVCDFRRGSDRPMAERLHSNKLGVLATIRAYEQGIPVPQAYKAVVAMDATQGTA